MHHHVQIAADASFCLGTRLMCLTMHLLACCNLVLHVAACSAAATGAAASGPLALALLNLAAASPSLADDVIAIGTPDKPLFALSAPEIALVLTPVVGYAIYNYARTKNPQLGFNDLLLISWVSLNSSAWCKSVGAQPGQLRPCRSAMQAVTAEADV